MAKYYASYCERQNLEALMGQMEQNSGPTVIACEWGHAAFIRTVRAGVCACLPTPHPHCSCVGHEMALAAWGGPRTSGPFGVAGVCSQCASFPLDAVGI